MTLNPTKCDFEVKSRSLFGFLVTLRGIEEHPDNSGDFGNVPFEMLEDVAQRLSGCMVCITRFMFKTLEKCTPFISAMKTRRKFKWDEEC